MDRQDQQDTSGEPKSNEDHQDNSDESISDENYHFDPPTTTTTTRSPTESSHSSYSSTHSKLAYNTDLSTFQDDRILKMLSNEPGPINSAVEDLYEGYDIRRDTDVALKPLFSGAFLRGRLTDQIQEMRVKVAMTRFAGAYRSGRYPEAQAHAETAGVLAKDLDFEKLLDVCEAAYYMAQEKANEMQEQLTPTSIKDMELICDAPRPKKQSLEDELAALGETENEWE